MKQLIFALLALLGAPSAAEAQLACALTATPVQFDSISGTSAGTFDARGAITVTCTGSQGANIAACIEIGQGARSPRPASGCFRLSKAMGRCPCKSFRTRLS